MKTRRILMTGIMLVITALCMGAAYAPDKLANPNVADRHNFISDPEGLLDADTKRGVNERLYSLRQTTTCEVAVAVVPDIGDMSVEEWSNDLFKHWGLGKSDKDNGVLLVIVPDQHYVRIETGYGVEGVLTDMACKNIINRTVIPAMRDDNDLDAAVNGATALMADALSDPAVAEELRS